MTAAYENISVSLFDALETPAPLATIDVDEGSYPFYPNDAGYTGVYSGAWATFDYFEVTGTSIPIPAAGWLLAGGLPVLLACKRRFFQHHKYP